MFGGEGRRRKRAKKVKEGDGKPLKPYRIWQVLSRSTFFTDLPADSSGRGRDDRSGGLGRGDGLRPAEPLGAAGAAGSAAAGPDHELNRYVVDVDLFDWNSHIHLYRDGVRHASAESPATFPVPGGVIDVATGMYGVNRIDHIPDGGEKAQLRPVRGSGEWRRARFARRHPGVSRLIGGAAVVILLTALAVLIPQIVAQLSQIPWVAENVGTFTSPIQLPAEVNTGLTVAGVFAGVERSLSMRNHWLIDAETWFMGD